MFYSPINNSLPILRVLLKVRTNHTGTSFSLFCFLQKNVILTNEKLRLIYLHYFRYSHSPSTFQFNTP